MNKQRQALELALKAIESGGAVEDMMAAEKAIQEALADPEQGPVTWQYRLLNRNETKADLVWKDVVGEKSKIESTINELLSYKDSVGQPIFEMRALYTAPQTRKPLNDAQIEVLRKKFIDVSGYFVRPDEFEVITKFVEEEHGIGEQK